MKRKCESLASLFVLGTLAWPWTVWAGTNQWTSIGPEGGGVRSLAVDPQNSRTLYAGTAVGIFKSQDRGASWSNSGLMGYVVATLGIDPQDPNTIYAVTQGHPNQDTVMMNVSKSTNGGTSWNEEDSGMAGVCCGSALVIDPLNRGTLYLVTGLSGVWKSTDGGDSWQIASARLPDAFIVDTWAIDPQSPNTLYAAGNWRINRPDAVFKSQDGGASWKEADTGLALNNGGLATGGLTIDPRNPATIYLTTSASGVFKTVNGDPVGLPRAPGFAWRAEINAA